MTELEPVTVRYTVLACSRRASCNRCREYTCFACPSNRRVSTILLDAPGFPKSFSRTEETLRTRWYQIVRFSKIVNKSITDVTEDDLIFYLAGMGTEGRRGVRSCVKVFYQWGMKRGLARCNPTDEVPTVPVTLPSGRICPEENIEQGLASPRDAAASITWRGGSRRQPDTRRTACACHCRP